MKPKRAFSKLEALTKKPSEKSWIAIVAEVEAARANNWESFCKEALPRAREALAQWPEKLLRVAPWVWIERHCFTTDKGRASPEFATEKTTEALVDETTREADRWAERYETCEWPMSYDLGVRIAIDVPELSLANTLVLSDDWSNYEPFDRRAFLLLKDCLYTSSIHTLLHYYSDHDYSAGPMIAPWFVRAFRDTSGWSSLRTVRTKRDASLAAQLTALKQFRSPKPTQTGPAAGLGTNAQTEE